MSTSSVFLDDSVTQSFLGVAPHALDNGLQAHLYTRPADTFIIQIPLRVADFADRVPLVLDVNARVWRRFTGLELASSRDPLMFVCEELPSGSGLAAAIEWFPGLFLEATVCAASRGGCAVLAFVLSKTLLSRLGVTGTGNEDLVRRAEIVTSLMDKNDAMGFLARHEVPSAPTTTFLASKTDSFDAQFPVDGRRYVFKPAGGAAGAGVFTHDGRGANASTLREHVERLRWAGQLPLRFQVQEYLSGPTYGASLVLDGHGGCRVLEIHRQFSTSAGRFVGASWTRAEHDVLEADIHALGQRISAGLGVPLSMGVDVIDGRIIEVNPRLTACAPIAHLLYHAAALEPALKGRVVERIDLETQVPIAFSAIVDGRVEAAVQEIRSRFSALVLPQCLDPFGPSRIVVVNDDSVGSARSAFKASVR